MATVTKSIGTNSRDYSTISAWEADLANGAIYSSGDEAIGECYNDSTFDESFDIDDTGPAFGLSSIILRANSTQKHDGTPDSGVKVTYTGTVTDSNGIFKVSYDQSSYGTDLVKIEDIEFADITISDEVNAIILQLGENSCIMSRCLVNNIQHDGAGLRNLYIFGIDDSHGAVLQNSMVFNCGKNATSGSSPGRCIAFYCTSSAEHLNVTVYSIYDKSSQSWGAFDGVYKNVIIANCGLNFKQQTGTSSNYNLSSDSTVFGSNSASDVASHRLFVSTTTGSEDLHLKDKSVALRIGLNLGTTDDVQKDIDGTDRDTSGTAKWDIGADQCATCSKGNVKEASSKLPLNGDFGSFNIT